MSKLSLEKAEEPEIKLPTSIGSIEKTREFQRNIYFCFTDYATALTVWIITNCEKFFKRWGYQTTLPVSWETCMWVKKQVRTRHGKMDWFKIGKGVQQGCILSPCLFNFCAEYVMQNAGWMNHKLEWRLWGEIPTTSYMQMIPLKWQKVKRIWRASWKGERGG